MIAKNILSVQERIKAACVRSGRNSDDVTLIAVSKFHTIPEIREVMAAGMANFGENKAQELATKFQALENSVIWHFLGHLQTNKVKQVVDSASYIHSVDSMKIAEEIAKQAEKKEKIQNILLEIKTSDEESKFGLTDREEIYKIADFCMNRKGINLCGLMTMAPFVDDEQIIRTSFRRLFALKQLMIEKGFPVNHLSMGMTGDFELAIEEGATMVRIGTAIFAERNYN